MSNRVDPKESVTERPAAKVQFGPYEADLRAGVLRKHDIRIRLAEQPFRILERLVRAPGELVSRDELISLLWPDSTHVEFEQSLNAAVKKLRRALDDSPTDPRFIQTLPKKGYRFIARVTMAAVEEERHQTPADRVLSTQPVTPDTAATGTTPWAGRLKRILLPVTAAVIVFGLLSWLAMMLQIGLEGGAEAALLRFRTRPLLDLPGRPGLPAFSSDGRFVAFTWRGEETSGGRGQPDIYVAPIEGGTPKRITDTPGAERWLSWSPEGKRIAFTRVGNTTSAGTYVVSLTDGTQTRVAIVSTSPTSWSPDGKLLIGTYGKIWATSPDTREQWDLMPESDAVNYAAAAISPDGSTLAFAGCRRPDGRSSCDIYVRPMDEEEPRRLTFLHGRVEGLAWAPNSREIIFSMDGQMFRMPVTVGTQPAPLEFIPSDGVLGNFLFPTLARSSEHGRTPMALVRQVGDVDTWVTEIPGTQGDDPESHKLVDSDGVDRFPEFSPDGTRIAFYSERPGGERALWVCDSDGSNARPVTPSNFRAHDSNGPAWSPDGRRVAFRGSIPEDPAHHIYTVSVDGDLPKRVTSGRGRISTGVVT